MSASADSSGAFAVTGNDLVFCNDLGKTAAAYAEAKHAGVSKDHMRDAMLGGGVEVWVADALLDTIFAITAEKNLTYQSIVASQCVVDRLTQITTGK